MQANFKLPPLHELMDELRLWFASDLGQQLLSAERAAIEKMIGSVFGYHLLQVGYLPDFLLYQQAAASHKFLMIPEIGLGMPEAAVVGSPSELPFASGCIDAVILHHALDFAESPHQVLREATRVLRPGGKLIVVSFNPASLWGLYHAITKKKRLVPWCAHFMRQRRLNDWLTLLEFKQERLQSGFYRPPFNNQRWMGRLARIENWGERYFSKNGAFHITIATKETLAATPVSMSWRRRLAFPLAREPLQQVGRSRLQTIEIDEKKAED
ncbi:MAG: methyltransferase domain-containing protein [Motiliproteus sp.]